jgi:hypothetical protein
MLQLPRGYEREFYRGPTLDAVPFVAVEGEAGDGQRFALSASFLHPVI